MTPYFIEIAWPRPSKSLRRDVVDFWVIESVLSRDQAFERAAQLLVVAHSPDGSIAAVSTAFPYFVDTLGLRCFFFRAFVGRAHRAQGLRSSRLIHQVIEASYNVLNSRFQQGIQANVVGIYMEVENLGVQQKRRELVWSDDGANIVFVGCTADGRHARVWYFENAKIPDS